jgi:5-oxoprolinase (ATP-hydrolysing)
MAAEPRWQFYVDRGGTFTDCIGRDPATGALSVLKVPSSDEAPLLGIRRLLGLSEAQPIPPCELRLGTTLGTNALLERRGARSALLVTRGFGDLLELGDQTRPDLFALRIVKPAPLPERVLEVAERLDSDGVVLERSDPERLRQQLGELRDSGIDSIGIAVLNDYREGLLETEIAERARELGFRHIARGFKLAPSIGYLTRVSTVALDAYLTPLLEDYLNKLRAALPGSRLLLMQSSGGLCDAERFRGAASVLSGPAGGAEGFARVVRGAGVRSHAVGFDMGGTSTDVSHVSDGFFLERVFEKTVAGTRIAAPMIDVHTVAAGGGSICRFDGERLRVGPESVGAEPGPLCYGRPGATQLSISDVNLALGRLIPDRFPLPLSSEPVLARLEALAAELAQSGHHYAPLDVAEGFFRIANATMAQAIREMTVERGFDLREQALVVLGGAAGQHACALARELGVREVLFHPYAGVLSAWGIGLSGLIWDGSQDAGGVPLEQSAVDALLEARATLGQQGRAALLRDGADPDQIRVFDKVGIRYAGTETVLHVPFSSAASMHQEFAEQFRHIFGYTHDRSLELADLRVHVTADAPAPDQALTAPAPLPEAAPLRLARVYLNGVWHDDVPVYAREELLPGLTLRGPAIVAEATGTIALEPGFSLSAAADGLLRMTPEASAPAHVPTIDERRPTSADPVRLEIYANRFMSIAEQMGAMLRQTAMSVNIRERLDFSCAVFDAAGELIANAPHIPVHLGAMSESVKAVHAAHPDLEPGDVFVTNDPTQGGSHLPDVTVVAPVHDTQGVLRFFAAARGHHADIGGKTPGSMPAFSRTLAEEGVVLSNLRVGRSGVLEHERLGALLGSGPFPARRVAENLADLQAQLAAVRRGSQLLLELSRERGLAEVEAYMAFVQDNAANEVRRALRTLALGRHEFIDTLDDGTPLRVTLEVTPEQLVVDFSGTGPEHAGNLNAPRAVTLACVLYFLRVLVGKPIPLNSGCLRHVRVIVPEPSLLSPGPERAVAGGNVETSQRVVDVLLAAAGLSAASQGTMNNLSFGDGSYGYYETIAGGAGAGRDFAGASAVHTHMTNTRITDAEVMERRFPVRVVEHAVRRGSGGAGQRRGGDGVRRTLEFRAAAEVSILSERRSTAPFGLAGGEAGARGHNSLNGRELPGAVSLRVAPGDELTLSTPGGGGYGPAKATSGA